MPSYTLYYFNSRGRAEICRILFAAAGVQYNDRRIGYSEWSNFKSKISGSVVPVLEIDGKTQIPQSMAIARYLAREFGFHGRNNLEMARIDFISDCFYEILDDYLRLYHDKEGRIMYDRMSDMRSRYIDMDGRMTFTPVGAYSDHSRRDIDSTAGSDASSGIYTDSYRGDMSSDINSGLSSQRRTGDSGPRGKYSDSYRSDLTSDTYLGSHHRDNAFTEGRMSEMRLRYMETCRRVLPFMERTLEMHHGGNRFFCGEQMMLCDMMCYCALENPLMENATFFNSYPKLIALRERVASHPNIGNYIKRRERSEF